MIKIISIVIFLLGYISITLEHFLKINKTAVSLLLGITLWIIASFVDTAHVATALSETAAEIFSLVIFLLSAMTLVEILTHYGLFDSIYKTLIRFHLKDRGQFFILSFLAFFFSAFLDNLTTTIVFLQIAGRFFSGKNLIKAGAAIVIAANSGGAFSPIGDVTTTMLWLAGKFDAVTVLTQAFFPSLATFLVSTILIGRSVVLDTKDIEEQSPPISKAQWVVIGLCLISFLFPLLMTALGLPPYFGLILGLGLVWLTVDLMKQRISHTSLSENIEKFFQKTDIGSLYFFIGILLAVGALHHVGVIEDISLLLFRGATDQVIIAGNIALGLLSSVFDNIPLTAAAIGIVQTTNPSLWVLLALTVGIGGSLLVIGSAPGIIAMTLIPGLTFLEYLRVASLPALLAYITGILVWYVQYAIR